MQAPQWTEFLQCPICLQLFNDVSRLPVSLACGHTVCKSCLSNLQRRQCQFCSSPITTDIEKLPVNDALLLLSGASLRRSPPPLESRTGDDLHYHEGKEAIESMALLLKPLSMAGTVGSSNNGILSRPMQRKLVTLINCQLVEAEGRARAMRAARSLGERTVTELLLHHQNQQQLSSNLWAAVRQRGCQFLGPALQEECLRLILLALEGGVQLSRKVLVMYVVQQLQEKKYHQASKTSVGHVVQLLYRASCFKVTKRDDESSLMELKEEFQSYEALRREHDSQIVQIAMEAGLRIAPDQWSSLLYGDTIHKSHMQSIIDKLQTPESFNHSIDELVIALTRSGDPFNLGDLREHFEYLSSTGSSSELFSADWEMCAKGMQAVEAVVNGLVRFVQATQKSKSSELQQAYNSKYKTSMCKDMQTRGICPRGVTCSFAHSDEEMERYRSLRRGGRGPMPTRGLSQIPRQPGPVTSMQPLSPFAQPPGMAIPPVQPQFPASFTGPPHGPSSVHQTPHYPVPYPQSIQAAGPPSGGAPMSVLPGSLPPKQQLVGPYSQDPITGMAVHHHSGPYSTPQPGRVPVQAYGQQYPGSDKTFRSMPPMGSQYARDPYITSSQYGGRPVEFPGSGHSSMEGPYSDGRLDSGVYREQVRSRAPILVERGAHSGGSGIPSFSHTSTDYLHYGRRVSGPTFSSVGSRDFDSMQYSSGLDSNVSYNSDVALGEYGSHQSLTDVHSHKTNMQLHHEDAAYRPPPYSHSSQSFTQGGGVRQVRPQWGSGDRYRSHDTFSSDQFAYSDMGYGVVNQHQQNYRHHSEVQVEPQSVTSYGAFTVKETSKPPPGEYKSKWSVSIDHGSGSGSPDSEYTAYRSKQRQSVTVQPPEKETPPEPQTATEPFTVPIASSPVSTFSFSPVVGTPTIAKSPNVRAEREVQSPSASESNGSLFGEEKTRRKSPLATVWDDNNSSVPSYGKSLWSNDTEPTTSSGDSQWQSSVASAWFNLGSKTDKKGGPNGDTDLDRKREELKRMEEQLKKREVEIKERESALAVQQKKISSNTPAELQSDLEMARSIQRQLNAEELIVEKRSSNSQPSDEELAWEVQRLEIAREEVPVPRGVSSSPQRKHGMQNTMFHVSHIGEEADLDHQLKDLENHWNANESNKDSVSSNYDVARGEGMDLVPRTPVRGSNIQ